MIADYKINISVTIQICWLQYIPPAFVSSSPIRCLFRKFAGLINKYFDWHVFTYEYQVPSWSPSISSQLASVIIPTF